MSNFTSGVNFSKYPHLNLIYLSENKYGYKTIYGSTVLLLDFRHFLSFLILYTVSRTPWMGD
jgi:hypothetical protein